MVSHPWGRDRGADYSRPGETSTGKETLVHDLCGGPLVRGRLAGVPAAVWAVTVAVAFSYMGVGLVDPILPEISRSMGATPGQTELLFSTYLVVSALVMAVSSWVASRIGRRRTLLVGLATVVVFSGLCAASDSVPLIIGLRGGWGVGNALFVSTALATVLGASAKPRRAIMLYEGALGAGMALGPLVGGLLGQISWRGPFLGTATLMAIGLLSVALAVPHTPPAGPPASVWAGVRAVSDPRLGVLMVATVLYNYGYFTLLAYAPFPLDESARFAGGSFTPLDLGLVFFGWGVLVAVGSVWWEPLLCSRFPARRVVVAGLVALCCCEVVLATTLVAWVQVVLVMVSGGLIGLLNTAMTEVVMSATDLPTEAVSSGYSSMRFVGGALAPTLAGLWRSRWGIGGPYVVGALSLVATVVVLLLAAQRRRGAGSAG